MHRHRNPKPGFTRDSLQKGSLVAAALTVLAFLAASCSCLPTCDVEVRIRAGAGAEGMDPGTVSARTGQTICWKNDDTVTHTVVFTDSPGKYPAAAQSVTISPGGTGKIKVHGSKPSGTYECHIDPSARADGLWPPGEPQVIVE